MMNFKVIFKSYFIFLIFLCYWDLGQASSSNFVIQENEWRSAFVAVSDIELDQNKKEKLMKSGTLVIKKAGPGPWPTMIVFKLIKADALTCISLYHALDYQKEYIPNLLISRPVKYVSPTEIHTYYELKAPWPLENPRYTHGTILSRLNNGYKVKWYKVHNEKVNDLSGEVVFLDLGNEHKNSLMIYKSLIWPKSALAGLVRSIAENDLIKSLNATAEAIESLTQKDSPIRKKYISYTEMALRGEFPYQYIIQKIDK